MMPALPTWETTWLHRNGRASRTAVPGSLLTGMSMEDAFTPIEYGRIDGIDIRFYRLYRARTKEQP